MGDGVEKRRKRPGRPKGSRNRRTLSAMEKMRDLGCDPLEELVKIGNKALRDEDNHLAASCFKEIATYIYPKLKALDISGDLAGDFIIRWAQGDETDNNSL